MSAGLGDPFARAQRDIAAALEAAADTAEPDGDTADAIFRESQRRVRRRTGTLARSGRVRVTQSRAEVAYEARYAPFVEAYHPFLRPAVAAVMPTLPGVYADHVDDALAENTDRTYR